MAHCGYEATAVEDMLRNPLKGFWASLRGPKTDGDMVPEPIVPQVVSTAYASLSSIPVNVEMADQAH